MKGSYEYKKTSPPNTNIYANKFELGVIKLSMELGTDAAAGPRADHKNITYYRIKEIGSDWWSMKAFAFAMYNGWSTQTLQAFMWHIQGSINADPLYLNRFKQFETAYKKNPKDFRFYGMRAWEYETRVKNKAFQRIWGFSYKKPSPNTNIYANKFELGVIKDRKACELSPDNYSLAGAVFF